MRWRGFEEAINNITNMFVLQTFKSESFCKYVGIIHGTSMNLI